MNTEDTNRQYRLDSVRRKHYHTNRMLWVLVFLLLAVIIGYISWQLFWIEPETVAQDAEYMDYSASSETQEALRILSSNPNKANVITKDIAPNKKVALTFDGLVDSVTMQRILTLLEKYDMTGTFFITGLQAAENPDVVKNISESNHEIGSYTLYAEKHMENLSQEELANDFCSSGKILKVITEKNPEKLKCNVTEYTDEVLEAASASGFDNVVKSTVFLNHTSFNSYEAAENYINKLDYRSIVTIKLSEALDASEYEPKEVVETPAIDKQPDLATSTPSASAENLSEQERLLQIVEWLLIAIQNADYSEGTEQLCIMNSGKLAEPINNLQTSIAATGYAFYGINRIDELIDILDYLDASGGVGTFFVTTEDITNHPEQIKMLIDRGQSIGLAAFSHEDINVYSACFELLNAKTLLEEQFNYKDIKLVMQPWGDISDAVKEATSAIGCELLSYDLSVASSDNKNSYGANQLMDSIFGEKDFGIKRGQIVFFRMDYFDKPNIIAEFIKKLDETKNIYPTLDIFQMIHSTGQMYNYPLLSQDIIQEVKDRVYMGQLNDEVFDIAQEYYVGNEYINTTSQLPGFTRSEVRKLDRKGRVENEDNAVFLTFDDWGTDISVTKILEVLAKHNVKATFFVRTNYVVDNPNLLRAIGMEGHSIASHTNNHLPLSVDPDNDWDFDSITEEEALELQQDIVDSYNILQSIVGDMILENGKPVLSRIFRPPTLAVSKIGMEAVYDCGFTYIVNGDYTTHDYEAESAEYLYKNLVRNTRSGSVVVMHMSANCVYTAEAVDMFLTYNETLPEDERFTFARLADYLIED